MLRFFSFFNIFACCIHAKIRGLSQIYFSDFSWCGSLSTGCTGGVILNTDLSFESLQDP